MKQFLAILAAALLIACGQPDSGARPKPTFSGTPGTPAATAETGLPITPIASAPLIRIVYLPLIAKA